MKNKNFVWLIVLSLSCFIALNYVVWKSHTEMLLTKKYDGGDLARMGYLTSFRLPRKNSVSLPNRHVLMNEPQKADLLTIGDSFSLGLCEGKNYFYQDYIASYSHLSVANVYPYTFIDSDLGPSPLDDIILLYNSGLLDTIKPKFILIESVERYCIQRFSKNFDFAKTQSSSVLTNYYRERKYDADYLPKMGIINSGNMKFLFYNSVYSVSPTAYNNLVSSVSVRELKNSFFSVKDSSRLLHLKLDTKNIHLSTDSGVEKLNTNLNTMADKLERKGIRLIFMPIVDKFDLYRPFMVDETAPHSCFFEKLRKLPKKYQFIDTKQILSEEVGSGEKDIFYPDDSHWSWKAAEKIFRTVLIH